jgi:hypothetical protein
MPRCTRRTTVKRAKIGAMVLTMSAVVLVASLAPASVPTRFGTIGAQQAEAAFYGICRVGMRAYDEGGGTWYDRKFVVDAPLNFYPSEPRIYYTFNTNPDMSYRVDLTFHGIFNGRAR